MTSENSPDLTNEAAAPIAKWSWGGRLLSTGYAVLRCALLCLAAAVGFVATYVPAMTLFFDKRIGPIYFPIVAVSIYVAFKLAKFVDGHLPPASGARSELH